MFWVAPRSLVGYRGDPGWGQPGCHPTVEGGVASAGRQFPSSRVVFGSGTPLELGEHPFVLASPGVLGRPGLGDPARGATLWVGLFRP